MQVILYCLVGEFYRSTCDAWWAFQQCSLLHSQWDSNKTYSKTSTSTHNVCLWLNMYGMRAVCAVSAAMSGIADNGPCIRWPNIDHCSCSSKPWPMRNASIIHLSYMAVIWEGRRAISTQLPLSISQLYIFGLVLAAQMCCTAQFPNSIELQFR